MSMTGRVLFGSRFIGILIKTLLGQTKTKWFFGLASGFMIETF